MRVRMSRMFVAMIVGVLGRIRVLMCVVVLVYFSVFVRMILVGMVFVPVRMRAAILMFHQISIP